MTTTLDRLVIDRALKDGRRLEAGWSQDGQCCITRIGGRPGGAMAGYGRLQRPKRLGGDVYRYYVSAGGVNILITDAEAEALEAGRVELTEAYRRSDANERARGVD